MSFVYETNYFLYVAKDAPPSYYDVMGLSQIKQEIGAAKDESSNPAVVMFRLCCICVGSCKESWNSFCYKYHVCVLH